MGYIKNHDLTLEYVQALLARVLPEYEEIPQGKFENYALLVRCNQGDYAGEIVGFQDLPHARRWILNERKSRDEWSKSHAL